MDVNTYSLPPMPVLQRVTGATPKQEFVALGIMGILAYALPPPYGIRMLLVTILLYVLWNRQQFDAALASLSGLSQSVLEAK